MTRALPIVGLLLVLAPAACAPANPAVSHAAGTPGFWRGFWRGLWHGLISPVTFVISLFNDHVGIYAVRNDGGWYDAGFMIGVSTVFTAAARGGGAAAGPRRAWRATATSATGEPDRDAGQA
jgi:hypothetical protein